MQEIFRYSHAGVGFARREGVSSLFVDRLASALFLLLYAVLFYLIYRDYVSVEWGYTGLSFARLNFYEMTLIAFAIAIQGWLMPQAIGSPSSVVLWMLTTLIYVPTMIITVMIGERTPESYYSDLAALSAVMFLASIVCRKSTVSASDPLPSDRFFFTFLAIFSAFTFILFYQYSDIMAFSSVEDVYFQRFAASDMGGGSIIGYIRTHYVYVFSSILFAAGFLDKRYWYLSFIGFFGYLVTYLIDASKIAFVIPLLVMSFLAAYRFGKSKVWTLNAGLAFLTLACGSLASYSTGAKLIADLVLFRSIAIPAQTFAQYSDVFSSRGYTWWSNVRGISSIVPPPQSFASDPFWPVLGQIVGAEFYGMDSRANLNANLFAGEGIAAAGSFGVLIIGLIMIVWLRIFDMVAKGWNRLFVILITVPLGMSITNTHLSTFLLSFGGLFWLALLYFYKPKSSGTNP